MKVPSVWGSKSRLGVIRVGRIAATEPSTIYAASIGTKKAERELDHYTSAIYVIRQAIAECSSIGECVVTKRRNDVVLLEERQGRGASSGVEQIDSRDARFS